MAAVTGASVILLSLGAAGFGLGYLSDQFGGAVDESGNGALKIAGAMSLGVAAWYAWERM